MQILAMTEIHPLNRTMSILTAVLIGVQQVSETKQKCHLWLNLSFFVFCDFHGKAVALDR